MPLLEDNDICFCPSMSELQLCQPHLSVKDISSKYYQEIGAEMIGNQLIIRMEKDRSRSKKKQKEWDPPCDCVEIQRPTDTKGPKIVNADYDDRVIFRVHSMSHLHGKEGPAYKSQTIAYKIGSCTEEQEHRCKTVTVYPQLDGSGSQEVYSDHITQGNQDIFLLKIKKKGDNPEQSNRNVELELRTPRPPTLSTPPPPPAPVVTTPLQPVVDFVPEDPQQLNSTEENHKKPKKKKK